MNLEARQALHEEIAGILCTAVVVRPFAPALTAEEIRTIALEGGIGPGHYDDYGYDALDGNATVRSDDGYLPGSGAWGFFQVNLFDAPDDMRPTGTIARIAKSFDELEKLQGQQRPKPIELLIPAASETERRKAELALGLLISWGHVEQVPNGFVRKRTIPINKAKQRQGDDPLVAKIRKFRPIVEAAFARRAATALSISPPLDRFGMLATQQGWTKFAQWWALTVLELRTLPDNAAPTSVCVITGALLEAALIAVAPTAKDAAQWRQKFLSDKPPERWNLGELIDQAAVAGTFTPDEAVLARQIAELRNRIHAGKFAPAGALGPLSPPYANFQEAGQARNHLDRLIDRLLAWPTIAALVST